MSNPQQPSGLLEQLVGAFISIAASLAVMAQREATAAAAPAELGLNKPAGDAPKGETAAQKKKRESDEAKAAADKNTAAGNSGASGATTATPASTASSTTSNDKAGPSLADVTAAVMAMSKKPAAEGGGRDGVVALLKHYLPNEAKPTIPMLEPLGKNQEIIDWCNGKKPGAADEGSMDDLLG